MDLGRVERWALAHHGLVPVSLMRRPGETDERRLGMPSTHAWRRAVASGDLVLVQRGVARLRGAPVTTEMRIAAAVLAVPGSMASHRSAIYLWGGERRDREPIDIIVDRGRARPHLDGVVVHRPTDRVDLRPVMRSRIPTTNIIRTLCDLGAVDPDGVGAAVEHAVVSGHVRLAGLRSLIERHQSQGRSGIGALRAAVDSWPLGDKPPDSMLEVEMARLLLQHRLPRATFHPVIGGYEADFLIDGTRIVLECDGWEWHAKRPERARRDRERDADLLALGYATVRFTWGCITRRPAETAAKIRRVVERWAPDVLAG